MEKGKLVSVIVPVYNVENYIKKCLGSILNQSYANLEIILVDDGSKDASGRVCDEYADLDSRVRVYHKENGGLSSARNLGLDHASGEYIIFIDSDDYFAEDAIELLVKYIVKYKADISVGRLKDVDGTYIPDKEVKKHYSKGVVLSSEELMREICLNRITGISACGKLYKKELFENIRYPVGKLYEDVYTTPRIVMQTDRAVFIDRTIYFWVQRNSSITHKRITEKDLLLFQALDRLVESVDEKYPSLHNDAVVRLVNDTFWMIMMRLVYDEDYLAKAKKIRKRYRKYWLLALRHRGLGLGKKIQVLVALINLRVYKVLRLLKNKKELNS